MASGIGMMMSSLEFLDNGSGGGTALDGTFTEGEGEAAMGITKTGATSGSISAFPATLSSGPLAGFPYLSGVVGATRYVFACADIGVSMPWCDNILAGSLQVHDDTGAYGTGAGFQGALQGVVDLTPANPVSLVFQITDLTLPFTLDPAKVPAYQAFSGRGNAAQGFAVGIEGYLSRMQTALVALAQVGSSSQNVLSDAVDSAKGTLDNGARCLPTLFGTPGVPDPALPDAMDAVFPIYQAAIGTSARPMPAGTPASNFFQAYNRIAGLDLTSLGITTPFAVTASSFVFGQGAGTVTTIGTRFLYAKAAVGAFDPAVATPRIDETPAAFRASFEAMRLAPAGSTARDGSISYAELLCIGAGAPPTGVTATAAPGQVTLTWNAALNATGYTVYRSTQPGVTQTSAGATAFPIAVPLPAAPAPPFTDPSAAAGTTYYYVVTSTNASGEGGISREVSATP
jgi:hypothetical protein